MNYVVAAALLSVALFYVFIGFRQKNERLGDFLPTATEGNAAVTRANEFSASTTATTISLVTVVLAFFELASWFGAWLFWSVFTTALGILLVRAYSDKIWDKLNAYRDHKPSLHEFLATEFDSNIVRKIASMMTALGFLGAFAVELTVGSKFLASMMPGMPQYLMAILLASVALTYTLLGGFRTVIKTDRYQMISIWLMIAALIIFFSSQYAFSSHVPTQTLSIADIFQTTPEAGLGAFLIGLALINIPTYLSDMSIWQRIAGTRDKTVLKQGVAKSVVSMCVSWSGLILLAIVTASFVANIPGDENPLFKLVEVISQQGLFGNALLFIISVGLFGAMLSTASTQLIASTHAVHVDVLHNPARGSLRDGQKSALIKSRLVLILIGALSIGIVELLNQANFSIADLVFAIYGAQLGLFPVVFLALFRKREFNLSLKMIAPWAIGLGFSAGWGSAIYGKVIEDGNLVFLSPAASIGVSLAVLVTYWAFIKLTHAK